MHVCMAAASITLPCITEGCLAQPTLPANAIVHITCLRLSASTPRAIAFRGSVGISLARIPFAQVEHG
jgi:hypothetical protein